MTLCFGQGVKVYVALYLEVELLLPEIAADKVAKELRALHPNIQVATHPQYIVSGCLRVVVSRSDPWSHHDKVGPPCAMSPAFVRVCPLRVTGMTLRDTCTSARE